MVTRIAQKSDDILKIFEQKLKSMQGHCNKYDQGERDYARYLALDLRILLHDSKFSYSVLGQIGKKDTNFFDTSYSPPDKVLISPFCSLYGVPAGGANPSYVPWLDQNPNDSRRLVPFSEWWNQIVIKDGYSKEFTRKDLILFVADQGGGAHVDPLLDEAYAKLAHENSLGWTSYDNQNPRSPVGDADLAAIRQITHEVLKTLIPNYPSLKMQIPAGVIGVIGPIWLGKKPSEPSTKSGSKKKIGRNDPCWCGAKKNDGKPKKFKKCHGA
ncbi:MAG: hypothetical protein WC526_02375 [Patescibacteria group bacterium]